MSFEKENIACEKIKLLLHDLEIKVPIVKAHSVSPQYSCGQTTTAASTIVGCPYKIDSTSTLLRFSPLLSISIIPIVLTPCLAFSRAQSTAGNRFYFSFHAHKTIVQCPSIIPCPRRLPFSPSAAPSPISPPRSPTIAPSIPLSLSPTASPNSVSWLLKFLFVLLALKARVEEVVDEGQEEAKEDTEELEAAIVAVMAVERVCQRLPVVIITAEETGCIQKQNPNSIN
ncbi:hypothetical protein VNO80_27064 [Phaseolus coccineus]|uniref:Uncharacterized protein n=1 Tax=Phaseolus coccineus TaxID=3886 RepID=A0AAN9QHQ4_PHACN